MRKVHLEYLITEGVNAEAFGDVFTSFFENQLESYQFSILENTLTLNFSFKLVPTSLLYAIAKLPPFNIKNLTIQDVHNEEHIEPKKEPEVVECPTESVTTSNNDNKHSEKPVHPSSKKRVYVSVLDQAAHDQLEKIAERSNSFTEFVRNVMDFMRLTSSYRYFFSTMVTAFIHHSSNQEALDNMEKYGEAYSISKRTAISKYVKEAFKRIGSESRIMVVTRAISEYANHDFGHEKEELSSLPTEETSSQEENPEPTFRFLSPELVRTVQAKIDEGCDSSVIIGTILDEIKCNNDDSFYQEHKPLFESMVKMIAKVAQTKPESSDLSYLVSECAKSQFEEDDDVAKAFLLQSLKNYAYPDSDNSYRLQLFFNDISHFV